MGARLPPPAQTPVTQHVVAWAFLVAGACGVIALIAVVISDRHRK